MVLIIKRYWLLTRYSRLNDINCSRLPILANITNSGSFYAWVAHNTQSCDVQNGKIRSIYVYNVCMCGWICVSLPITHINQSKHECHMAPMQNKLCKKNVWNKY